MPATQSSTIDNLGDICIYRPELDGRAPEPTVESSSPTVQTVAGLLSKVSSYS